jgi:hypothetical protein
LILSSKMNKCNGFLDTNALFGVRKYTWFDTVNIAIAYPYETDYETAYQCVPILSLKRSIIQINNVLQRLFSFDVG